MRRAEILEMLFALSIFREKERMNHFRRNITSTQKHDKISVTNRVIKMGNKSCYHFFCNLRMKNKYLARTHVYKNGDPFKRGYTEYRTFFSL